MSFSSATEIRVCLLRQGVTQAQIARELGLTKGTVNQVIHGKCKSQRVQEFIEKLMEKES